MNELHQLLMDCYRCYNEINRLYAHWARRHGMTYDSLFTLYAIYSSPQGCRPSEISDQWAIPKQTVSSILKAFLEKGYLEQRPGPSDRRNKILSLTPAGLDYCQTVLAPLQRLELAALEGMGLEACRTMNRSNEDFYRLLRRELEGGPSK